MGLMDSVGFFTIPAILQWHWATSSALAQSSTMLLQQKIALDFLRQHEGPDCLVLAGPSHNSSQGDSGRGEALISYLAESGISLVWNELGLEAVQQSKQSCPFLLAMFQTIEALGTLDSHLNDLLAVSHPTISYAIFTGYFADQDRETLFSHQIFEHLPNMLLIMEEATPGPTTTHLVFSNVFEASTEVILVNTWNGTAFVSDVADSPLFPPKMRDLKGRALKASAVAYAPFFTQTTLESGEKVQGGLELKMVKALTKSLNASIEVDLPTDGGLWGHDDDGDGLFDGIVGDLQQRRVDVGFAQFFIKYGRLAVMDFSYPYDHEYDCFLTLKPPPDPQILALLKPFTMNVWLATMFTMTTSTVFMIVLIYMSTTTNATPGLGFILVCSAFSEQSYNMAHTMKSNIMRISYGALLLCSIVISRGYSGGLTSFLSVSLDKPPLENIKDIALDGTPVSSLRPHFFITETSTNPWVIDHMRPQHYGHLDFSFNLAFKNFSEGKAILMQSKQFLAYNVITRLTNKFGETQAHIARECPVSYVVAVGFAQRSIYKETFDQRISRFKEAGLIQKWTKDSLDSAGRLLSEQGSSLATATAAPLSVEAMQGPIVVGFSLLVPACLIFAIELGPNFTKITGRVIRYISTQV